MRTTTSILFFLVPLILLGVTPVFAQTDLRFAFNPDDSKIRHAFRYGLNAFEKVDGKDGADDFGLLENEAALRVSPLLNDDHELFLTLDFYWLDIDNDDTFPADNAKTPTDLYDLGFGGTYRWRGGTDWDFVLPLTYGSATPSGDLFNSVDEMYVSGVPFVRFRGNENLNWILLVDFDTKRDHPILPGAGIQVPFGDNGWAAFGFPFAQVQGTIGEAVEVKASYRAERNVDAEVAVPVSDHVAPFVGFSWIERYFMRPEREDNDDRTVYEDKRVFGGLRVSTSEHVSFRLKGGWVFGREFGEGDDRDERNDNEIEVDDGWFGGVELEVDLVG